MDTAAADPLTSLLFGKTRRAVLGLLFTRPDESFHLREVARLCGLAVGPVQREVNALASAGLLVREPRGRQVFFRLDPRCPVLAELKSLILGMASASTRRRRSRRPLAAVVSAIKPGNYRRRRRELSRDEPAGKELG